MRNEEMYLFEKTVEIHMNSITGGAVKQNVLAVAISQPVVRGSQSSVFAMCQTCTYPSTNPTIDMTAKVRAYAVRAVNHAFGSGHISKNH